MGLLALLRQVFCTPDVHQGHSEMEAFYAGNAASWQAATRSPARPSLKEIANAWDQGLKPEAPASMRGGFCSGISKPASLER